MEKPIIATTLSGLFLKAEPWKKAHILWFKEASQKLNDPSIDKWVLKPDYFKGVDIVMQKLFPDLSDEQRTIKARETYFDSVCKYISQHPEVKNNLIAEYFGSLKNKYRLALITTNKRDSIDRIISLADLSNLFDIIESSEPYEKDDKTKVFDRFIKLYGKPIIYVGGDKKDSFDYCAKHKIPCVFANLEGLEDLDNVDTVHNLEELKERLGNL